MGTRIGETVIDLHAIATSGLFSNTIIASKAVHVFSQVQPLQYNDI